LAHGKGTGACSLCDVDGAGAAGLNNSGVAGGAAGGEVVAIFNICGATTDIDAAVGSHGKVVTTEQVAGAASLVQVAIEGDVAGGIGGAVVLDVEGAATDSDRSAAGDRDGGIAGGGGVEGAAGYADVA